MAIILRFIKSYLTLFWQCSCLNLIFSKRHFRELATKSKKHVLMKISSTNIYNVYNRYLRNDRLSMFREGEKSRVGATFLPLFLSLFSSLFCMFNHLVPKLKIWLLIRETLLGQVKPGKLSKSKCLINFFVVFLFFSS